MSRLSVQAEQDSAPVLGIDEKLAEAGYLTSVPVVVHPKLPPYRYRLYGEDDGRLERIDVFDEQSRRVIQQISWPSDQDDPEPLDGRTPEIVEVFDGTRLRSPERLRVDSGQLPGCW